MPLGDRTGRSPRDNFKAREGKPEHGWGKSPLGDGTGRLPPDEIEARGRSQDTYKEESLYYCRIRQPPQGKIKEGQEEPAEIDQEVGDLNSTLSAVANELQSRHNYWKTQRKGKVNELAKERAAQEVEDAHEVERNEAAALELVAALERVTDLERVTVIERDFDLDQRRTKMKWRKCSLMNPTLLSIFLILFLKMNL